MRDRGTGDKKMAWNIDMREARDLHLGVFYKADYIDHLIQNGHISYHIFKYWN